MDTTTTHQEQKPGFFTELFKFAFIALIIVVPIRMYVAQPFIVSGASMDPTFTDKQYLIVDELTYRFKDIARDDVVVFHPPVDPKKYYIKRVIGLPGETVEIRGTTVTIKNNENPNGFVLDESYIDDSRKNTNNLTFVLGPTQYFTMGDNRIASYDSRAWGPLEEKEIIGRPIVRLFPLNTIELFPGTLSETQ